MINRRTIPAAASEARWIAPDGHAIRRIDWPGAGAPAGARGSLLFLPGRGDFYEKYLETLDHWHQQGWAVTALDWRGQAGSGRFVRAANGTDVNVGHVTDFTVWLDDLAAFWTQWRAQHSGPRVVVAHSMGGHLALRALAERRIDPDALVLSAPMLGFTTPGPRKLLHALAWLMTKLGDPTRRAWKASERPGSSADSRQHLLTHDIERYADEMHWREQRPELFLGPASWGWIERAYASFARLDAPGMLEAVQTPVLLFGTQADGLVSWKAIKRAAKRLPQGHLMLYGPEAAHELFREEDTVRNRVLQAMDAFLEKYAPVTPRSEPGLNPDVVMER